MCVQTGKRWSTGALQNAKREMCVEVAATFWSAALLRRFSISDDEESPCGLALLTFCPADYTTGDARA
jgi:hypothetical protein